MVNYRMLMKILNMDESLKSHREELSEEEIRIEYPDIRDLEGIRYPEKRKKNEEARHNWYSQNRRDKKPAALPDPLKRDLGLSAYQRISEQKDDYQEKAHHKKYGLKKSGNSKKKDI